MPWAGSALDEPGSEGVAVEQSERDPRPGLPSGNGLQNLYSNKFGFAYSFFSIFSRDFADVCAEVEAVFV